MKTSSARLLILAAFSIPSAALFPQSSSAAASGSDARRDDSREIVTLSEFNVTASAATEYAATESTTGTRVASRIRDLPFSVNVVTGELLDDFNAVEFRDQMAFTSN